MKTVKILCGLVLLGSSVVTFAGGYSCPAAGNTSGGWVPQECAEAVAPVACPDCGTVESVNVVDVSASGVGAVAGAVAGGVIGNKLGSKKSKTLSTIIGAVGGGVAGHYGEKMVRGDKRWDVIVLMEDGSKRSLSFKEDPGYQAGDKVTVSGETLTRR